MKSTKKALAEFKEWVTEECDEIMPNLFAKGDNLFQMLDFSNEEGFSIFNIFETKPDGESFALILQVLEFLDQDAIYFKAGQKEMLEDLRRVHEAEAASKQFLDEIDRGTKVRETMARTLRQ